MSKAAKRDERDYEFRSKNKYRALSPDTALAWLIFSNADPDVRVDLETFLSKVVPEGRSAPWIHTDEGDDDMPGHIKSSMFGASLMVPITKGRLNLGTWQGIYLCEHRDHASGRRVVVTLQGE